MPSHYSRNHPLPVSTVLPGEAVMELPVAEPEPPLALEPMPLATPPVSPVEWMGMASDTLVATACSRAGKGCPRSRCASSKHNSKPAASSQ